MRSGLFGVWSEPADSEIPLQWIMGQELCEEDTLGLREVRSSVEGCRKPPQPQTLITPEPKGPTEANRTSGSLGVTAIKRPRDVALQGHSCSQNQAAAAGKK